MTQLVRNRLVEFSLHRVNEDLRSGGHEPQGRIEARAELSGQRQADQNETYTHRVRSKTDFGFFQREAEKARQGTKETRSNRRYTLVGGLVVVGLVAGILVFTLWPGRGSDNSDSENMQATKSLFPVLVSPSANAVPSSNPTTPRASVSETSIVAPRVSGPIWYKLTQLRAVTWNNGFDLVDPVRIGAESFPASIVGNYQSSASDQNNKAVWAIGGQCSEFKAWIGKNTDSGNSGIGSGRFVILGDGGRELYSETRGPTDPALLVDINIAGVTRLTIYDTRGGQDMANAWGSLQILCAGSPGPAR
ncbi:NPCBM/NEW2 domain-containing protein [Nocardia concava]|uniref:NPCBM/NEW2 domain-containing protein n=1 Tax=Nocardia concava TaxID=257281 RepID=UPI0012F9E910|nr:NPCBM/NEW2 domain-containing protein [Nocardia concava]